MLNSELHFAILMPKLSVDFYFQVQFMARQNRRDLLDPNEVSAFHCVQRTVRRAWIQDRLAELAGSFGIDCFSWCFA